MSSVSFILDPVPTGRNVAGHYAPVMAGRAEAIVHVDSFKRFGNPLDDVHMRAVDAATDVLLRPPGAPLPTPAALFPLGLGIDGRDIGVAPSAAPYADNTHPVGAAIGSMANSTLKEMPVNALHTANRIMRTPSIAALEAPIEGEFVFCRHEGPPSGLQPHHLRADVHNYARPPTAAIAYQTHETVQLGMVQMNYMLAQLQLDKIKEIMAQTVPVDKRPELRKLSLWARRMVGGPDRMDIVDDDGVVTTVRSEEQPRWKAFRPYFADGVVYRPAPRESDYAHGNADYYHLAHMPPKTNNDAVCTTIAQVIQAGRFERVMNVFGDQATPGAALYFVLRKVSVRALSARMHRHFTSYYHSHAGLATMVPLAPRNVQVETATLAYTPTFSNGASALRRMPQGGRFELTLNLDIAPASQNYDHYIWQLVPVAQREGGRIDAGHLRPRHPERHDTVGLFDGGLPEGAPRAALMMQRLQRMLDSDLEDDMYGRAFLVGRVLAGPNIVSGSANWPNTTPAAIQALSPDDAWPIFDAHPSSARDRIDAILSVADFASGELYDGIVSDYI